MHRKKKVTINDIAEHAGVSKATVSFAFNMPWKILPETKDRVMRAAEALGYTPDPVARTLATKRVGAIGLLLPDPIQEAFRNPYLFEVLQGIGMVCNNEDLVLTMLPPVKGLLSHTVNTAVVDGFLTIGISPDPEILSVISKRHIPFVTIDGAGLSGSVNVGIDDYKAAYDIMTHVINAGHRRIAVISVHNALDAAAPSHVYRSKIIQNRMDGLRHALEEVNEGHAVKAELAVYQADANFDAARSAVLAMFNDGWLPTAIVCLSDIAAVGVYDVCAELGVAIPEDISVTGFDGIEFGKVLRPRLTTIVQPGYDKGIAAANIIVKLMKNETCEDLLMPYFLFEGDSVKTIKG